MRIWAVPIRDAEGSLVLWVGGAANKNKDRFEQKFSELIDEICSEIDKTAPAARISAQEQPRHELKLAGVK